MNNAIREALSNFADAQAAAAAALAALVEELSADTEDTEEAPAKPAKKASVAKKAPAKKVAPVEVEDEEDEEVEEAEEEEAEETEEGSEEEPARLTELKAMRITGLRALAIKHGYDKDQVADATKEDLVEAIWDEEKGEAAEDADAEDESDEDGAEGEEEGMSREDLEGKNLRELKALAKEAGYGTSDLNGLKSGDLIDLLLGEGEYAEGEEGDDEEAEEGGDDDVYTEEMLQAMSLGELKTVAREYGIDFERNIKKPALIDLILGDEEE